MFVSSPAEWRTDIILHCTLYLVTMVTHTPDYHSDILIYYYTVYVLHRLVHTRYLLAHAEAYYDQELRTEWGVSTVPVQ